MEKKKLKQSYLEKYLPKETTFLFFSLNQAFTVMKCLGIEEANDFHIKNMKRFKEPVLETLFLFSILTWLYVIAMQVAHPESVSWTLTSWFRIRLDVTGEIAFLISVISFFILRYEKRKKDD